MRSLSVRDLLDGSGLDLRVVAGEEGLTNMIRWAHVSELADPTPWLKGGELLLTTGMGIGTNPGAHRAYIRRLVRAGLAGVGFGTGFSHEEVPRSLGRAADAEGFPLFEVPYDVPFIAITEAVFSRVAAEQYEVLSRSLEAEHTLTREVLEGRGVSGILRALARTTRGWAVLLDPNGKALGAEPDSALERVTMLAGELRSPRAAAARFGVSLVDRGEHVAIQPVAAQGRVEAYLAFGKRGTVSQLDRIVSSHALSLLALELDKARAVADAERRLKGDLLDQILRGSASGDEARFSLERLGFHVDRPVTAVLLAAEHLESLGIACDEALAPLAGSFLCSIRDEVVMAVVQQEAPGFLGSLHEAISERYEGRVIAGAGNPVAIEDLGQGVREAHYALRVCRTEGRRYAEFSDLGTYQLLLSLQDPDALRTFATSVLGPLDEYDQNHGGELVPSLRAFLESNSRWEAAARQLYVHRHTLRYRMRKVEELTRRDLGSARDRMEFFLALRARDMLTAPTATVAGTDGQSRTHRNGEPAVVRPVQPLAEG